MKNRLQKALSLLLTIIMIFSVGVLTETNVYAKKATYYVENKGSDKALGTSEKPFKTISKAISTAVEEGFKAGDTVTVKVLEFAEVDWGDYCKYDFNLKVDSGSSTRCNIALPKGVTLGGNVSFSNAVLNAPQVFFDSHNVEIDETCILDGENYYLGTENFVAPITLGGQTVRFETALVNKTIYISDKSANNKTYKEDVNLIIKNANAKPSIVVTPQQGATFFASDFNINLMSASSVTFVKDEGITKVSGAIQLITDPDVTFVDNSLEVLKNLEPGKGFYHIVNKTRVADMINTTDIPGKYKVNTDRYKITAENSNGKKFKAKDGYLELPSADEYIVTAVKQIETETYYVSSKGKATNSGLKKSSPLPTVGDAILAAKEAGYWEGDTITVKILGEKADWGVTYETDSENKPKEEVRSKKKYGYDFLLVVRSYDKSDKATLTIPKGIPMLGDVKFDYINIPSIETFSAYDQNVTMTKNVSFNPQYIALGFQSKQTKVNVPINLVLKNKFSGYLELTNGTYAGKTFNHDVTVTVDNSKSTPRITFVVYWRGITTFNGNLNINIANAKSVSFGKAYEAPTETPERNEGKAVANKAVHLIVNSKTEMDSASISNLEGLSAEGKLYHISNDSGIKDILEFTKSEGKFKVKSDEYIVTAVNVKGKATVSKNGYLKLKKPGYYSITAQKVTDAETCKSGHKYSDNCDAMCNVCSATRTIKHKYKYSCSRACEICGIKRIKYHSIGVRVIPATDKKDGENQDICRVCDIVLASEKIEKIASFELVEEKYTYDGTQKIPKVVMKDTTGEKLVEDVDYNLTYPKDSTKVGSYKIKIKFKGEFKGTKYLTFKINPPKTSVSKVTAAKKSLKVTIKKKSTQVTGYQIQYSTSKTFKEKYTKTKTVKSYKTTSVTLKSLKAKKTYYVRVRTYKTVDGKKYYSSWSKYVKKKTK